MEEYYKNLAALDVSNLVRVCLNETLQPGGSLEECKSTLKVLPSYLLYAICRDPVFNLLDVKNIFLLIKEFFTEAAIKKIGCEATTQLVLLPLKTMQEVACGLVLKEKSLTSHLYLLDNIVLNAINIDCSLSISPETNEQLQNCYPELNFTNISEVTNEDIISTKIRCAEDLQKVVIGEKIKLCDSFESAMLCTYCELSKSEKNFLSLLYPNRTFTDEEMKKQMTPRHQRLKGGIVASKDFKIEINNIFLGEKIIQDSACANIDAIRVPFFTVTKACSFSPSYPSNEMSVPSDNFYECEKRIESLTKKEKKIFCEKPSFFFRNREQGKLNNSLQVVETLCDRYLGSDGKDELQQTLELIKVSNATNNITNTSIQETSSSILNSQASLLYSDKLDSLQDSSKLINSHTALETTLEYRHVTAIAGTSLAAVGVVGGIGYWLFKGCRKPAQNFEACNDKQSFESPNQLNRFL